MALEINTVIVFGDSLSDIGKKWTSGVGRFARFIKQIRVNGSGRFSDCRNWTDHMFEDATGRTMVSYSDSETIKISEKFTSYSTLSVVGLNSGEGLLSRDEALGPNNAPPVNESAADYLKRAEADLAKSKAAKAMPKSSRKRGGVLEILQYANYAEGGVCGDTPNLGKRLFLGTFRDQVDAFEKDCKSAKTPLHNTLFIIWFGGNDVYTANRDADKMRTVAIEVARTQRKRLLDIFDKHKGNGPFECKFIFVDLARPLTMARFQNFLNEAARKDLAKFAKSSVPERRQIQTPSEAADTVKNLEATAVSHIEVHGAESEWTRNLRKQMDDIKRLEQAVLNYNAALLALASENGDVVAELGNRITEDTLAQVLLKPGTYELKIGAKPESPTKRPLMAPGAKFVAANDYGGSTKHVACVDELHPTDHVYLLIWLEIREKILESGYSFGNLTADNRKASPLTALAALNS